VDATWETDPVKQKELFDKVNQDTIQPHLEKVEQHLVKNGGGHLVGQGVSSVDFVRKLCSFNAELFLLIFS
jgi:glutathione S-transferase